MSDQIRVSFDVPATMRDGVVLRANIYQPAEEGCYPVALTRTPYGKDFAAVSPNLDAARLARAGYLVVIQDVRGRFASEGTWLPFHHERADGYDTVEWAASLPQSSGVVGMFGSSYLGYTQWMAAAAAPPSLKAIVPAFTWADVTDGVVMRDGAVELGLLGSWLLGVGFDVLQRRLVDAPPEIQYRTALALAHELDQLRTEGYFSLPLKDFSPLRSLQLDESWDELLTHLEDSAYYTAFSIASAYEQVTVPSLNIGGWYDIFTQGTLANAAILREGGSTPEARQAKVVIGPWSHGNMGNTIGDLDFGMASQLAFMNLQTDLHGLTQRWFDYWLKGIDTGIVQEAPVRLFVMGENIWRDEAAWPLARAVPTPFYLHPNGLLAPDLPPESSPDSYHYDPADPTPTVGGSLLMHPLYGPGVQDQRDVEARPDVLSYTTPPLPADVEVTGPITVTLWAASDARDTDFVARLVDVHPDGFAQNLADGIVRARYRNGPIAELLEPHQVYAYTIDLWAVANLFKAGHQIRVDIASANFPRWDRNPNTGEAFGASAELHVAHQRIYHDAAHPSQIILPIVPHS